MPYSNIPESLWPKMERCTAAVRKSGKSEQVAIAICYSSIMGKKVLLSPYPVEEKAVGDLIAPKEAQENAARVLRWRDEHPDEIRGMTRVGWTRANQLAKGKPLSWDVVGRMAQFARHRDNAKIAAEYEGEPWKDAGYVAWLGWGGDAGIDWAQRMMERRRDGAKTRCSVQSCTRPPTQLIAVKGAELPYCDEHLPGAKDLLARHSIKVEGVRNVDQVWIDTNGLSFTDEQLNKKGNDDAPPTQLNTKGNFITTEDGRVVFVGGPSSGGGESSNQVVQHRVELSETQQDALDAYFGDYSSLINNKLRGVKRPISDYDLSFFDVNSRRELDTKIDDMISEIDTVLSGNSLDESVTVYRGFDAVGSGMNYINPGDIFSDPAFLSTSTNVETARSRAVGRVPIIMTIRLQKGDNALFANGPMPENEVLLPRGLQLKLVNETEIPKILGGGFRWEVEIVRQSKKGNFVTIDNRVVFIGGPSSGGGSASKPAFTNPDGTLMEFYHGGSEIDEFKTGFSKTGADVDSEGWYGEGIYLTSQRWKAAGYGQVAGRYVTTAVTTVTNPLIGELDRPWKAYESIGIDPDLKGAELSNAIMSKGYDALALKRENSDIIAELVIYDPKQLVVVDSVPVENFEWRSSLGKKENFVTTEDGRVIFIGMSSGDSVSANTNDADFSTKAVTPSLTQIATAIAERTNNKAVDADLVRSAFLEPWLRTVFGTPESNRLQKVTARTFGFPDPPGTEELDINWKLLYPMGEMYNITQDYLKERGFSEFQTVPVYRPYLPSEARPKQWQKDDEVRIRLLPLTSWTLNKADAVKVSQFLGSAGSPAFVLKTFIPIKSVVSTPNTGIGMPGTSEVVLAGGEYEAVVDERYE